MSASRRMFYCFNCRKGRWHEPTMDGGWVCSKCLARRPKPEEPKRKENENESPENRQPQG